MKNKTNKNYRDDNKIYSLYATMEGKRKIITETGEI